MAVYSPVSTTASDGKTVYVELRRRVPAYFTRLFGFSSIPIVVSSKAKYTPGTKTTTNPFNSGPFANAAIYAGQSSSHNPSQSDIDNSIYINTQDDKTNAGIGIAGNIYTNGRINLNYSGMIKATGDDEGNGGVFSPYATSAKKDNPVFSNTSKWNSSGINFTGNYGFNNTSEYDIDYSTSTESAMTNINDYITQIINSTTAGTTDTHDGNLYLNNTHTIHNENLSNEYSTSVGEQIYYTDSNSRLTVNMLTTYTNTNTATNTTQATPMFSIGGTSGVYGYNIIIANGDINATTGYDENTKGIGNTESSPVILISLNGSVALQNDNVPFYGIIYAPNGTVRIDGHNNNPMNYTKTNNPIYGSIVAKQVYITTRGTAIYHDTFNNFGGSSAGSGGTSSSGTVQLISVDN